MKEFYLLKSYLYEINDVITDEPELLQDRNVLEEWNTCFVQLEDIYKLKSFSIKYKNYHLSRI